MPEDKSLSIGWQILFKLNMILVPLTIAWAAWATTSIFELRGFAGEGPRFTAKDATSLELGIKEWTRQNFPPANLVQDIREIKNDVQDIKVSLARLQQVEDPKH